MTKTFEPTRSVILISRVYRIGQRGPRNFLLEITQDVINELKQMCAIAQSAESMDGNTHWVTFASKGAYYREDKVLSELLGDNDYVFCRSSMLNGKVNDSRKSRFVEAARIDAFANGNVCFHADGRNTSCMSETPVIPIPSMQIHLDAHGEASNKDLLDADHAAASWLRKRACVHPDSTALVMPAETWRLLEETLRKDAQSTAFDRDLRAEISSGLEQITVYEDE